MNLQLPNDWSIDLEGAFQQDSYSKLRQFLSSEKSSGKIIYPPEEHIFSGFKLTPFNAVKVVILGQDPYHGLGQAHGLSFSVQPGVRLPPSLVNIYKELASDVGIERPTHGCLESWAKQGVLLLNAVLTVEADKPGSHAGKGWEEVTDAAIRQLSKKRSNLVFILWGSYAQKKSALIDGRKHLILKSVHPSPLSSYRGFFGSKPFSKANAYLVSKGLTPIDWQISAAI